MPFCMYVVKVLVQYLIFIGLVSYIDLVKYFYFSARIFTSVHYYTIVRQQPSHYSSCDHSDLFFF